MTPQQRETRPTMGAGSKIGDQTDKVKDSTEGMTWNECRTLASALASAGIGCFPVALKFDFETGKVKKRPTTPHGHHDATTNPTELAALFARYVKLGPGEWPGVGAYPGPGNFLVLDVDDLTALDLLETEHGRIPGRRVRTPSGGLHIWMRLPEGITVGQRSPWAGIDVRSSKGWAVAPGVHSPWGAWTVESGDHAPAPNWTVDTILDFEIKTTTTASSPLVESGGNKISAGGRNEALFREARSMNRRGWTLEDTIEALGIYNSAHCDPPHSDAEVQRAAQSAYERYEQGRAESPHVSIGTRPPAPTDLFLDWDAFWAKDHTETEWLYPDVLARGRGHAIYAPAGSKKSLFALYIAASRATSSEKIAVIYLDYEMSEDDLFDRLEDMGYGADSDLSRLHYALLPALPPLDTREGGVALTALLDNVQAQHADHEIFVVIDTTGRAVEGEENSSDTFRRFYAATGIELKRRGVTWVRLDHTGKDISKGQRGSKGKDDDPDIVWLLRETDNGIMLTAKKRRMGWVPERVAFIQSGEPLSFSPVAGDWPKGTEELAGVLDRLMVPVDASTRTAQTALKDAGEGRRRELIVAAQKHRNHYGNHPTTTLREPPAEPPPENAVTSIRGEPLREPPGTTQAGSLGTGSPLIKGTGTDPTPEDPDYDVLKLLQTELGADEIAMNTDERRPPGQREHRRETK